MKKGSAMEGFIREDGTIRPIEHYDDTELRDNIRTNTVNISNIDSRVTELEEHGGVEDQTKADKVENATAGNLASLDENGNLQDSGKKPADFAPAVHTHSGIEDVVEGYQYAKVYAENSQQGDPNVIIELNDNNTLESPVTKHATIGIDNIDNLNRALRNPSTTPENDATKLITSKAVYEAIEALKDVEIIDITRSIGSSSVAFLLDSRVLTNIRSIISRHNVPQTYIPVEVRQHNGTSLTGKDALGYMYFERDYADDDEQTVTEFVVRLYVAGLVLVFTNHTPGEVNVPSEDLTTWEDYDALSPSTVGYENFLD